MESQFVKLYKDKDTGTLTTDPNRYKILPLRTVVGTYTPATNSMFGGNSSGSSRSCSCNSQRSRMSGYRVVSKTIEDLENGQKKCTVICMKKEIIGKNIWVGNMISGSRILTPQQKLMTH